MPVLEYRRTLPKLARDVYIAHGAMVIGDVEIGEGSSIWFNTVVRGDVFPIRIGARTNIQDNSVIHVTGGKHATIIGSDVTAGHRVIIHGCTIEDGALIGMGAIVMDRAVVGRGALVAAGALVSEGTVIPPGALAVGSPARVKRPLNPEEAEYLRYAAEHYSELGAEYAARYGFGHDPLG
jgi:carbonic anhydrase/acetyltransferase-like protein (isoleucine patch superfamily)